MFEPTLVNFLFIFFVIMIAFAFKEGLERLIIYIAKKIEKRNK